jgi:hypothetical protein
MPRQSALEAISTGRICNITLAFALQWLELNRDCLVRDSGLLAPGST